MTIIGSHPAARKIPKPSRYGPFVDDRRPRAFRRRTSSGFRVEGSVRQRNSSEGLTAWLATDPTVSITRHSSPSTEHLPPDWILGCAIRNGQNCAIFAGWNQCGAVVRHSAKPTLSQWHHEATRHRRTERPRPHTTGRRRQRSAAPFVHCYTRIRTMHEASRRPFPESERCASRTTLPRPPNKIRLYRPQEAVDSTAGRGQSTTACPGATTPKTSVVVRRAQSNLLNSRGGARTTAARSDARSRGFHPSTNTCGCPPHRTCGGLR